MGTTTNIVDPSSTNGPDYVTLHEPDTRLIAMLALSNSKPARPDKQRLTVFSKWRDRDCREVVSRNWQWWSRWEPASARVGSIAANEELGSSITTWQN